MALIFISGGCGLILVPGFYSISNESTRFAARKKMYLLNSSVYPSLEAIHGSLLGGHGRLQGEADRCLADSKPAASHPVESHGEGDCLLPPAKP